jgi:hypothetical protein
MTNSDDEGSLGPVGHQDQEVENTTEDYLDQEFVTLQKTLSQKRRHAKECAESRIQQILPFPFSPNIRPLTVSDLGSCVALENAAFPNPEHRASPEKVSGTNPQTLDTERVADQLSESSNTG